MVFAFAVNGTFLFLFYKKLLYLLPSTTPSIKKMLKKTVDKVIREKRYSTTEIKLDVYHYWAQSI